MEKDKKTISIPSCLHSKWLEETVVALIGAALFITLNAVHIMHAPEKWTSMKVGAWSAFAKDYTVSGFDFFTYVVVTAWRPMYDVLRHPLLMYIMWPFYQLNDWMEDEWSVNCAIYIVAVLWIAMSTATWLLLYKLLKEMTSRLNALLLCFFYYGLAYVMMVTFIADHMVISQMLLLIAIYLAYKSREGMAWWKAMIIYTFATGVTLTNGVKLWINDMLSMLTGGGNIRKCVLRSAMYIIPTCFIFWAYHYQTKTIMVDEQATIQRVREGKIKKDSTKIAFFAREDSIQKVRVAEKKKNQVGDSHLFQFTDNSVARLPLLYENMFGEGFLLHEDHLLEDADSKNAKKCRPVFVVYRHCWEYIVNAIIIILFVAGVWYGRKNRLIYLAIAPLLFDLVVHIGFRFAAKDIYIMTAHWAFVLPIAMACLLGRNTENNIIKKRIGAFLSLLILVVTLFLWYHNLSLIAKGIFGCCSA